MEKRKKKRPNVFSLKRRKKTECLGKKKIDNVLSLKGKIVKEYVLCIDF